MELSDQEAIYSNQEVLEIADQAAQRSDFKAT